MSKKSLLWCSGLLAPERARTLRRHHRHLPNRAPAQSIPQRACGYLQGLPLSDGLASVSSCRRSPCTISCSVQRTQLLRWHFQYCCVQATCDRNHRVVKTESDIYPAGSPLRPNIRPNPPLDLLGLNDYHSHF
ncbi:hypothetical protein B0H14DRAFT_3132912, partial [Mycena olivaceomarginata]